MYPDRIAMEKNIEMDSIIDSNGGWKLSTEAADKFVKVTHEFLCVYTQCCKDALSQDTPLQLFSAPMKCHYLLHAAMQGRYLHPKLTWCFTGEDFMKHSRRLLATCCQGLKAADVAHKFAKKYLFAMHLQFAEHAADV